MYSKIPVPGFEMRQEDMAGSLTFFPLVGLVIGGAVYVLNGISPFDGLPAAVRIILTLLLPLAITGGFHADGFMDTQDALNSYSSKEKKLEILKDPHIGAFAVISLLKWELFYGAAVTAILLNEKCDAKVLVIFGLTFVISRCLSGLTSVLLPKAKKTGMLHGEAGQKQTVTMVCLTVMLVASAVAALFMNYIYGGAVLLTFALFTAYYRSKALKEFGGVTGDTAGFYLTVSEILSAAALALIVYLV
jgi:adenosylcobinamide-GDP ribazoletransferase